MGGGTNRASTVRALIRGESLTAFEAASQLARADAAGIKAAITVEHVTTSLAAVADTVFPHRLLETQKLWMNRSMLKPRAMTTRITSAAISCINNALALFSTGTDASKFTKPELVGLLEWSLPPAWREEFDLKGYIPSKHNRTRLVTKCEAIERHVKPDDGNNKTTKYQKTPKKRGRGESKTTPREVTAMSVTKNLNVSVRSTGITRRIQLAIVGPSRTVNVIIPAQTRVATATLTVVFQTSHSVRNCTCCQRNPLRKRSWTCTQVRSKRSESSSLISRKSDMHARKQARNPATAILQTVMCLWALSNPITTKKRSDIDLPNGKKRSKAKTKKTSSQLKSSLRKTGKTDTVETMAEEKAYQKTVEWLKDHGDSDIDEDLNASEDLT
jgi:hypothetical protein